MTEKLHHQWVKHTVTKVSLLPDLDDDRQVVAIEDPSDVEAAEEGAVYGCNVCGVPMEGNTDTMCDPMCHCGMNFSEHTMGDGHNPVAMR